MKKLIVNADDFGLNEHTVRATIKGFEQGSISSATLMASMPMSNVAIEYAKSHPEFSFGVHFYLVDEVPVSKPESIPSMINPKTGKLWSTREFILRNFARLVRVEDIKTEMEAQYLAIERGGVSISHVDGHGHNHRLPQSIQALYELSQDLGFTCVRRCQNIVVGREGLLSRLINNPMQRRLVRAGFRMTDYFAMNAGHSNDVAWFSRLIDNLPDGIMEIGVHPGSDEVWRTIDTEDCYRHNKGSLATKGIEMITYKEI